MDTQKLLKVPVYKRASAWLFPSVVAPISSRIGFTTSTTNQRGCYMMYCFGCLSGFGGFSGSVI